MAIIGTLEVKTFGTGANRVRVVRLPGHEFGIEHFFPQNHKRYLARGRVVFVRSSIDDKPEFIKKEKGHMSLERKKLTLLSEVRLVAFINSLKIEGISAEQPLAVITQGGRTHVVFRQIAHQLIDPENWDTHGKKALEIERALAPHGITPIDTQWFKHQKGITLFDLEGFQVTDELKRKLGLKYMRD